jgi:Putative transposase, YhgA-like
MNRARILEIVRQFPENGLKLLLHHPANTRDLLSLTGTAFVPEMAFERMTVDPTTYITSDYRHVASDLVLRVPLRGRPRRRVIVYLLIEHQSEPDPLMLLRVMDYLAQIWKGQVRAWRQRHGTEAGVRLQPILPVVLYTGTRTWPGLGGLADVVELGERFEALTPFPRPLFVNLPELAPAQLESAGGYFGWVLELLQQRHARTEEFRRLLQRVVEHLETMPEPERLRWLELLSYIQAMVYHVRVEPERPGLRDLIVASVRTDPKRQEVTTLTRTIAEALRDEGRQEGAISALQRALLRQLRSRFGKVPKATERLITTTRDIAQLEAWSDRFATATSLEDVGITPPV